MMLLLLAFLDEAKANNIDTLQLGGLLQARPAGAPLLDIPAHASIQNMIQTKGAARVIVRFAAPVSLPRGFALEPDLDQAGVINQRSIIARLHSTVLSRLSVKRAAAAKRYDFIPFMALEVDQTDLKTLIASPEIDFIEEDFAVPPLLAQSVPLIGGVNGSFSGSTGSGQTVAILDTGVEKTHPFLSGKVVAEGCFSTTAGAPNNSIAYCTPGSTAAGSGLPCSDTSSGCWHGTHVAGIAAGKNGPAGAPSGVARDANLISIQVFSQFSGSSNCGSYATCPLSYISDQISALQYVFNLRNTYNIASVNMSLGGGQYSSNCDATIPSLKTAIDNLRAAGIATVIASGNDGSTSSISLPACISTAISVGATDKADVVASYSNSALFLNLLSPGSSITSSYPAGLYATASGTSMATPHVAGAWAVIKSAKPTATVDDILNALVNTGKPVTDSRNGVVKPRIQVDQAVYALIPPVLTVTKAGNGSGTVTSTPVGIVCGATCSAGFTSGTNVTLTATPETGSAFIGWSGACSGAGTCTVTMDAAKNVTATFSLSVNGVCGSANGQTFDSYPFPPTATLCTAGTASSVTGVGPWNWTCIGQNGGSTASCSSNITAAAPVPAIGRWGMVMSAGGLALLLGYRRRNGY